MTSYEEHCWVCGEGPIPARCMIIGEAPGPNECKELRPFIGDAGQFLRDALGSHEHIRISNIAKSFPGRKPNGEIKRPSSTQIQAELPYLIHEIALVKPEVILALGGTAVEMLTGVEGVEVARAAAQEGGGFLPLLARFGHDANVIPTWHPSYIMKGFGRQDEGEWRGDIGRF